MLIRMQLVSKDKLEGNQFENLEKFQVPSAKESWSDRDNGKLVPQYIKAFRCLMAGGIFSSTAKGKEGRNEKKKTRRKIEDPRKGEISAEKWASLDESRWIEAPVGSSTRNKRSDHLEGQRKASQVREH